MALECLCRYFVWKENEDHPGSGDPRPFFGDFSGLHCDCPGHPEGSHRDGTSVDILYFTNSLKGNNTQNYGVLNNAYPLIKLWNDYTPVGTMDVQRNIRFWMLLRKVFPYARLFIRDFVSAYVDQFMNTEEHRIWFNFKNEDCHPEWNHNTHCHLYFDQDFHAGKDTVDWDYLEEIMAEMD